MCSVVIVLQYWDISFGTVRGIIDIGHEQNAFLHFSDVSEATNQFLVDFEEETEGDAPTGDQNFDAAKDLKQGNDIVVQIMKEPIGSKGSRVTSQISIPGRYAVLVPNQSYVGVSRKIQNFKEKKRLKSIARQTLPKNFGLIIRTQAEEKPDKLLMTDIKGLLRLWEKINKRIKRDTNPRIQHSR